MDKIILGKNREVFICIAVPILRLSAFMQDLKGGTSRLKDSSPACAPWERPEFTSCATTLCTRRGGLWAFYVEQRCR